MSTKLKAAEQSRKRKLKEIQSEPEAVDGESDIGSGSEGEGEEVKVGNIRIDPTSSRAKLVNKTKVLVFSTRGINQRQRHLLGDLRTLIPHGKKDAKLDEKDRLNVVNEVADLQGCNLTLFLEARKKKDLFLWASRCPTGPSIKFLVQNIHTMDEMKLTGNHLKGSRPLVVFDSTFDSLPHLMLMKELLLQIFSTPKGHRKSKPFIDHVYSFFYLDGRVWFRNFQIVEPEIRQEAQATGGKPQLVEVGPRFVLQPIRIFAGSFGGPTLYENTNYVSPNEVRAAQKREKGDRYTDRVQSLQRRAAWRQEHQMPADDVEDVFLGAHSDDDE
eukprot:TRINITY_DN5930_c0_g1::TRINITY_DN5930_c0_g1_i1::g.9888::m.9888 TRINITY_DN5930_c0_g1::TRINITY_DN5930_c0_g1_i1::g.9888  ORF type:complete len:329 (+),score=79.20,sp/Q8TDN6/BRX1_HUMAN/48.44/2e-97,Brix/PF04427.13/6.4e-35,Brix/PF04427.13/1e+03 TRINITY_DN5930_c0_g1_i1:71-1057(+)